MAVSSESGEKLLTAIFLSSLMISLGIAAATDALIDNDRTTLHEKDTVNDVILHVSQLNEPGFQEGSVFTDTTLSAGGMHTCAILDNGSVSCWGRGSNGQLGNGETSDRTTPTLTSSLGPGRTAVALSSGTHHTCAILDNGSVSCWGDGYYGQLGNGGTSDKYTPTLTSSLGTGRTAVALSSGGYHTCAILDNGDVSCWGWDITDNWVMEEHLNKTRPRSPAVLARVVRPWRFLLDTVTHAPYLTTGVFRAGDAHTTAI